MATLKDGKLVSLLEGNQTVVYAETKIPCLLYSVVATFIPENEHVMLFDFT